jgi:hypothetical protein
MSSPRLLDKLDRLEERRPNAVTCWSTTKDGFRWQANVQMKANGGWHVQHGRTIEEAMASAIAGALRGDPIHDGPVPSQMIRDRIREFASDDEEHDNRDLRARPPRQRHTPSGRLERKRL